jgi:hypothetical protein
VIRFDVVASKDDMGVQVLDKGLTAQSLILQRLAVRAKHAEGLPLEVLKFLTQRSPQQVWRNCTWW